MKCKKSKQVVLVDSCSCQREDPWWWPGELTELLMSLLVATCYTLSKRKLK